MTREEALGMLGMIKFKDTEAYLHTWYKGIDDDVNEAVRMAIEIVEAEPCEDAISRSQALSDYADWYGYGYRDNTFYKLLKDMPSVKPKSKTDVIDKIRAEIIERDRNVKAIRSDGCCFFTVEEVLKIIDKYKESEGEG